MAVNLSPYGGVGAQFLDNSGNVLTGGKIFTYAAGTTTNQVTYTTSAGNIPHSNPIILDASGRVPSGGEIWLTDGFAYKFILRDANDVLIATYDNVTGINSNFVAFTNEQEIQTATAGQTVFNLTTITYQPATNSLTVFVDGVNQYGPGAQYAYLETDGDTVTFVNGLHVGAEVKFTTSQLNSSASQSNAFQVSYTPPFTNSVGTNVGDKLAQTVSVEDFGAVGDGVTDNTTVFTNAIASFGTTGGILFFPPGEYLGKLNINKSNITVLGYGAKLKSNNNSEVILMQIVGSILGRCNVFGLEIDGDNNATVGIKVVRAVDCAIRDIKIVNCELSGVVITGDGLGASTHIEVSNCRINGPAGVDPTAVGINIGGGGVNAATRLFNNYIADYPTSIYDAGVNTVDVGGIFETGVNAVITTGGDGVFIGNWVETGSFSGAHFRIGDARTTIIGTHGSTISDVDSFAPGQFPARNNKILMQGASVLGNVVTPDGGVQYYSGSIGGSITADAPKNLRGTVQISGAATSATATFVNAEPNTSYYIVATPISVTGTPSAGSNRVTTINKTTLGFTINVEVAPGGVASVIFDWIMVR